MLDAARRLGEGPDRGSPLWIGVLGPVVAVGPDGTIDLRGPRQRALLARLVLSGSETLPARLAADELWGSSDATDAVKMAISRLRGRIGADAVESRPDGYRLASWVGTDVADAEDRLRAARLAAADLRPPRSVNRPTGDRDGLAAPAAELTAALGLWRGIPYAELDLVDTAVAERERLESLRLDGVEDLLRWRLIGGEVASTVGQLEHLVADHPWRESFTELLMVARYRAGRQRDALAAYEQLEQRLRRELGLAPNPRAQRLHLAILRHEDGLEELLDAPVDRLRPTSTAAGGPPPGAGLLGRGRELDALLERWHEVEQTGEPSLVVVRGPAGIGKTSLLDAFAGVVRSAGRARVLHAAGRAEERGPFQVVGDLLAPAVVDLGRRALAPDLIDLAIILPGVGLLPAEAPDPAPDAAIVRQRLVRAVDRAVVELAAQRPSVLLVDDAQWADTASLSVVHRLLERPDAPAVLTVLAVRREPGDEAAPPDVEQLIDRLGRRPGLAHEVELSGLSDRDARRLVAEVLPARWHPQLDQVADQVIPLCEGNPLFLRELTLHIGRAAEVGGGLALSPSAWSVPSSLASVLAERLAPLPAQARRTLQVAAVAGPPCRTDLLAELTGQDEAALLRAIDDPQVRSVATVAVGPPPTLSFAHGLLRQALLEQLSDLERARIHASVAAVLGARGAPAIEVAHHQARGGPFVPVEASAAALVAGADEFLHAGALEAALDAYRRAAVLLADRPDLTDLVLRLDLGLACALAALGHTAEARDLLAQLMDRARAARSGLALAEAIVAQTQWGVDPDERLTVAAMAAEALDLLGDEEPAMRVRLLVASAWQLLYSPQFAEAEPLIVEAVAMARRLDDPTLLAIGLQMLHAHRVAELAPLSVRQAIRTEISGIAAPRSRYEGSLVGGASVFDDLVEAGDLEALRAALDRYEVESEVIGRPYDRWSAMSIRFVLHQWEGDLPAAEAAMARASEFGRANGIGVADAAAAGQLLHLTWERGELPTAIPLLEHLVANSGVRQVWAPPLALAYLLGDRPEDAVALVDDLVLAIGNQPHPQHRAANAAIAAHLVDALRHPDLTEAVEAELAPLSGRIRVYPTAVHSLGPVDRMLGLCALARDDLDGAVHLFEAARLQAARCRLALWEPRAAVAEADARLRRRRGRDEDLAMKLLDQAEAAAARTGAVLVTREVERVRRSIGSPA